MTVQITVPALGESITEATVAKWLKKVGDTVEADEPLVELETDKVSLEVPAPSAGVLSEILVQDGADVAVGAVLGRVEESGAAKPAKPKPEVKPEPKKAEAKKPDAKPAPAEARPAAGNGGGAVEVVVPAVGESVTEGTIAKWLKKVGDSVAVDEPLVELETDKATVEIPSTVAGTLSEIRVEEGSDVQVGATIAVISAGAVAPAAAEKPAAAKAPEAKKAEPKDETLSPAVRKLVDDNKLDPSRIAATGPKGQITKGDVLSHLEKGPAPAASSTATTRTSR